MANNKTKQRKVLKDSNAQLSHNASFSSHHQHLILCSYVLFMLMLTCRLRRCHVFTIVVLYFVFFFLGQVVRFDLGPNVT